MTNKTEEEDEEKTCLLSDIQQELLSSPEEVRANPDGNKMEPGNNNSDQLVTGDAERSFYEEVVSHNQEAEAVGEAADKKQFKKACHIHNSRSFPCQLELKSVCEFCLYEDTSNNNGKPSHQELVTSVLGPVLSVDVHCPADTISVESLCQSVKSPQHLVISTTPKVMNKQNSNNNGRPCKHSVNRFQRFYSSELEDSSKQQQQQQQQQLSSAINDEMFVPAFPPPVKTTKKFYGDNKVGDVLQNVDKIETICETTNNSSELLPTTTTEMPKSFASGLPERLRHCSEAAAMALAQKFRVDRYFLDQATKIERSEEEKEAERILGNESQDKNLSFKSQQQQLQTSLMNQNAKFDFFQSTNNSQSDKTSKRLADHNEFSDDQEDFCDSQYYQQIHQKLLPNNNNNLQEFEEEIQSPMLCAEYGDYYDDEFGNSAEFKKKVTGGLSQSSSTMSMPVCRICQLPGLEPNNQLISPCRCLGSIRYVHNNCLLKWLEVSSRRRSGPPSCELCQYQYHRHKKFVVSHWRYPDCSLRDKVLHLFFVFCVLVMIACAGVTIVCFKEDRWPAGHPGHKYHPGELSPPELISLSCAILFFSAFFLAMYVELKAKYTVYQLLCKFFYMNHEWTVEEYDRRYDVSRKPELEMPG